ncbi:MAG: glutaredoxin family protein [Acidobacteria bacterium]|nr:glutaredoxin family protein [Acidobacteriota bacterium]
MSGDPPEEIAAAVLYARQGCSPCFALKRLAARSARRHGVPLRVVDIDSDPALRERYDREVPVLDLPGGGRLQGRVPAGEVDEAFRRAAGRGGGAAWLKRLPGFAAGDAPKRPTGDRKS